jgi:hypothetical protein
MNNPKPGEAWAVTIAGKDRLAVRSAAQHWVTLDGAHSHLRDDVTPRHRVLVIDPEDAEQIRRFGETEDQVMIEEGPVGGGLSGEEVDAINAEIVRRMIEPRISEPTNLMARVRTDRGATYVKIGFDEAPWRYYNGMSGVFGTTYTWGVDLAGCVVEVLDEGIES